MLVCISHHLMGEARHRPAIPSFGLLAVLNVGFKNVGARPAVPEVAERRAACTDAPLDERRRTFAGPARPARILMCYRNKHRLPFSVRPGKYVEHGESAQRSRGGPIACFGRQPARKAG